MCTLPNGTVFNPEKIMRGLGHSIVQTGLSMIDANQKVIEKVKQFRERNVFEITQAGEAIFFISNADISTLLEFKEIIQLWNDRDNKYVTLLKKAKLIENGLDCSPKHHKKIVDTILCATCSASDVLPDEILNACATILKEQSLPHFNNFSAKFKFASWRLDHNTLVCDQFPIPKISAPLIKEIPLQLADVNLIAITIENQLIGYPQWAYISSQI